MARVLVVGGGIAGLRIAKQLEATLITDNDAFVFKPLLTDSLRTGEQGVVKPVMDCHEDTIIATAKRVDTNNDTVETENGEEPYDALVLATGAQPVLPVAGAKTYAQPFYTLEDAHALKQQLPAQRVVVVGGGSTGVELAAELSAKSRVVLVHRGDTLVERFSTGAQAYAKKRLEALGVEVLYGREVSRVTGKKVFADGGIPYDVCVWTAGVQASVVEGVPAENGVLVDEHLRVKGAGNVFAAGDCAQTGAPLTAQAAVQEAGVCATNVERMLAGKPLEPFSYHEKGRFLALKDKAYMEFLVDVTGWPAAKIREAYYAVQFLRY